MNISIESVLQILGAIAFFIYGMKTMSDGIQRAAGAQLRTILRTMTRNRFLGVLTGFIITLLIQTSSATTVMTVSFVNAGLLSLVESAGVMIGANVGTTITGWLFSVLGFQVQLSSYCIPLFAIGVPMILRGKGKIKYWGQFIVGFSILFLGLGALEQAIPSISENPAAFEALKNFTQWSLFSRIIFVLIGALLTMIIQSSSVSMAITLTMCVKGWLPLDMAAAMVLGENIGTTITAELAALVGNTAARRSARIHSLFNIIGVAWMVLLLPWFLPLMLQVLEHFFHIQNAYTNSTSLAIALAAFHTCFNTLNVCLMLPLIPWLVKIASYTVKAPLGEENGVEKLKFITNTSLTPELSTDAVHKETAHFGDVVSRMNNFLYAAINSIDQKEKHNAVKRLYKYESITDMMEIEITEYITKLEDKELTQETSSKLRSYLNIANDLERIGDLYFQIAKTLEQKAEDNTYLLPEQRNGLNQMIELVSAAFKTMNNNLSVINYHTVDKQTALTIEDKINMLRNELRSKNLDRIGSEDYKVKGAMVYNNLFSCLEQIGDHIISVTESVVGEF